MQLPNALYNIRLSCEERLRVLYPAGIPPFVWERYEKEMRHLVDSDHIADFEILRILFRIREGCSAILWLKGSGAGSILTFLLAKSELNPMPPHYYCPDCGHFEIIQTKLFGIDLPEMDCPICGKRIWADGFRLPIESVWGVDGKQHIYFEYACSGCFGKQALPQLQKMLPNNDVVLFSMSVRERAHPDCHGVAILPEGKSLADYPENQGTLASGETCFMGGTLPLNAQGALRIPLLPCNTSNGVHSLQYRSGLSADKIPLNALCQFRSRRFRAEYLPQITQQRLFESHRPKTYYGMSKLLALAMNTYRHPLADKNPKWRTRTNLYASDDFRSVPACTQEDLFEECMALGIVREQAYHLTYTVTHGGDYREWVRENVPEEIRRFLPHVVYLYPRAYCLSLLLMVAKKCYLEAHSRQKDA